MKSPFSSCGWPLATIALMAFAFTGCGRDGVKVYTVENTNSVMPPPLPAAATAGAMPATMPGGLAAPDNSGLPPLKYTLPAGWKEKELTQMRVASFAIIENGRQADVSVIPMGGMAGGNLANVNRWRGQVGQEPVEEEAVVKMTEKVVIAGQDADLFDIAGSGNAQRILASVLHHDGTAWFFKVTGDADLVKKNKAAFISFLKSVEFGGLAAPSTMDLSKLPPSHPPLPGMNTGGEVVPAADAGDKPTWTIPAGWKAGPLTQFLIAKYVVAGTGDMKAEVNVSSLEGDGGGLAPNVNRWRGQLGLPPAEKIATTSFDVPGGKASVVDFSGNNPRNGKPGRLIGAIVPIGGQTWFYKLMGDTDVVAAQKDAFTKFVQSAKYPDVH
jgi:hypothetical protein